MGFFQKRIKDPILQQLKQGVTPSKLAQSVAFGATIALFPLLGTTTLLCFLTALIFKLNQPMIQLVNYIFYPVQLLLIPVFARLGETIWGSEHIPFSPLAMKDEFMQSPKVFLEHYGKLGAESISAWLLCAPFIVILIYFVALRSFQLYSGRNK